LCRKLEPSSAPVVAPSARQAVAPSSLPDFDDWRTPKLERVSMIRDAVCALGWAGRFGHARLVPLEGVVGGRRRIKNLTLDGDARATLDTHEDAEWSAALADLALGARKTCAFRLRAYPPTCNLALSSCHGTSAERVCRGKHSVTTQTSCFSCFPASLARFSRVFPPRRHFS
jgi:hypothetical protein